MNVDAPDRCPRCGAGFACGAGGPTPCDCGRLQLSATLLAALRERYRGCLCLRCLRALADAGAAGVDATAGDAASH